MNTYSKGMEYFDYKEKIHEIGYIQDQGYIIAAKMSTNLSEWYISAVSDNIISAEWISEKDPSALLNKPISQVFDPVVAYTVNSLIRRFDLMANTTTKVTPARNFQLLRFQGVRGKELLLCCSVVGCSNKDTYVLEFENVEEISKIIAIPNNRILQSGELVGRIRACDSIESVTSTFLDAVMEVITGYDRGMVYRFGDDGSGEVIYENVRDPSLIDSSYLNLRFPAEDIPPQARLLYMKNGVRFIQNVNGVNSKIISSGNDRIDLTMSCLRAASQCHLQYLKNMGVVASMSIAIVVEETLWGLYTFHSYTNPTKPSVEERIMLEMAGSITAMRVHSFIREQNAFRKLELGKVMLSLQTMKSVHEFLQVYFKNLLQMVDAHAIILFYDQDERVIFGDASIAPTKEGYEKLHANSKINLMLAINNFCEGLNGSGAGVIFYRHQYVTIAFIRRNKVSDVSWGGKPDVPHDPTVPERLQPRVSFELYVEKGRTEARSWTPTDMELAQFAIDRITQYLHTELLSSFRLSLDQSNSECLEAIKSAKEHYEFFAHMSHELRTPFHGVMSSLQILETGGQNINEEERKEIVESALECGKTMLRTLDDILTIAKSRNNVEVAKVPFMISKMFSGTKRMMGPIAEHKSIKFESVIGNISQHSKTLREEDFKSLILIGDEVRLGQIANNLTNNAIKFTPASGSVTIYAHILNNIDEVMQLWKTESQRYDHSFLSTTVAETGPKYTGASSLDVINQSITNSISQSSKLELIEPLRKPERKQSLPNEVWFIFEVEDTGCGVKESDMKTMFDAYKQLSSGVSKTYQGTGLGLHICKLHVDSMNGLLGVASTTGRGTLFAFAVPMLIFNPDAENSLVNNTVGNSVSSNAHKRASSPITGVKRANSETDDERSIVKKMRKHEEIIFLVVDDSTVNLRLTKRKIQLALGDHVIVKTALDGFEGIDAYESLIATNKQKYLRGIFMDYHMPKCSGIEAIMKIRSIENERKNLKPCHIVAFTADLSETSSHELLGAGADEVLPKPTPSGQLEEVCIRLVNSEE